MFVVLCCFSVPLLSYELTSRGYNYTDTQDDVMHYLRIGDALGGNFTANEQSHLADVGRVVRGVDIFFLAAVVGLVVLGFSLYREKTLGRGLLWGGVAALLTVFFIGSASALDFLGAFDVFHLLFFPQGNWQFPPESALIRLFPPEFFVDVTKRILMGAAFVSVVMICIGLFVKRGEEK